MLRKRGPFLCFIVAKIILIIRWIYSGLFPLSNLCDFHPISESILILFSLIFAIISVEPAKCHSKISWTSSSSSKKNVRRYSLTPSPDLHPTIKHQGPLIGQLHRLQFQLLQWNSRAIRNDFSISTPFANPRPGRRLNGSSICSFR